MEPCYKRSGYALSLSLGNLSQKTSREIVHTFCRRFHLSPLLCSVRIQQCQLRDICHPLSRGIVELESKKPHLWRQPSLTALAEKCGMETCSFSWQGQCFYLFLVINVFLLLLQGKKITKVWAPENFRMREAIHM